MLTIMEEKPLITLFLHARAISYTPVGSGILKLNSSSTVPTKGIKV